MNFSTCYVERNLIRDRKISNRNKIRGMKWRNDQVNAENAMLRAMVNPALVVAQNFLNPFQNQGQLMAQRPLQNFSNFIRNQGYGTF